MSSSGPLIRDISDTALATAMIRAQENERPTAMFRDPYARPLAGVRGEQIMAAMPAGFAGHTSGPFLATTYLFDQFIQEQIQNGVDLVISLAAGLDARPYRLTLPSTLQWVEVDLPDLVDYKEEILRTEKPNCIVQRVRLDLTDVEKRRELFSSLGARAKKVLIVAQGLLVYFSPEEVASLARDLAAVPV
jgi:methyltransferase (TIGR00027 family)